MDVLAFEIGAHYWVTLRNTGTLITRQFLGFVTLAGEQCCEFRIPGEASHHIPASVIENIQRIELPPSSNR